MSENNENIPPENVEDSVEAEEPKQKLKDLYLMKNESN